MTVFDKMAGDFESGVFEAGLVDPADTDVEAHAMKDGRTRAQAVEALKEKRAEIMADRDVPKEVRKDRLQRWMERHGSKLVERVAGEGEAEKVEAEAEAEWSKVSPVNVAFAVDDPDSRRTLRDEERTAAWARGKVAEGPVGRHEVKELAQRNPNVARAILTDPLTAQGIDPILPDDDLREIVEARVREKWPERWARIETRRRVAKLIRRNAKTGADVLRRLGVRPEREDNVAATLAS